MQDEELAIVDRQFIRKREAVLEAARSLRVITEAHSQLSKIGALGDPISALTSFRSAMNNVVCAIADYDNYLLTKPSESDILEAAVSYLKQDKSEQ